jgi:ribosomal protein L15E
MEGKPPFAGASLEELGRATRKEVKAHQVQNGLLRLEREGFLERAMRGGYAIGDPMVRIWLERVRRTELSAPRLPSLPK